MFATSVRMTIEWFVPIGQARPITMALHSVADGTRTSRGCLGCSVATDIAERGTVRYIEEWLTEDDLRKRVGSEPFIQLVTLIEDATQPPRIEFALADGMRGFDFVAEVWASKE
jgi:quinol monooxygenase YgiN